MEQLRDLPSPFLSGGIVPKTFDPLEQRRFDLFRQFQDLSDETLPALARGLRDPDVRVRRNVVNVLYLLGSGWNDPQLVWRKLDIQGTLPALITALHDTDSMVRNWTAHTIGTIGPNAAEAVPGL